MNQIIETIRAYQELEERAHTIAEKLGCGGSKSYGIDISFEDTNLDDPDNATFEASWETYHCGCCGSDYHSEKLPLRFLFIEDDEELQAAIQEYKEAQAAEAAKKKRLAEIETARLATERARIKAGSAQRIADAQLEAAQGKLAALEAA